MPKVMNICFLILKSNQLLFLKLIRLTVKVFHQNYFLISVDISSQIDEQYLMSNVICLSSSYCWIINFVLLIKRNCSYVVCLKRLKIRLESEGMPTLTSSKAALQEIVMTDALSTVSGELVAGLEKVYVRECVKYGTAYEKQVNQLRLLVLMIMSIGVINVSHLPSNFFKN